jgi:glycerate kinase
MIQEASLEIIPMADGGEGTVEALVTATSGKIVPVASVDALNRPIKSFYGVLGNGKTAVIEMAAASGLELLSQEERNPLITSTYGTGLLLKAAMEAGFSEIIIGIGGSATNDGGAGMAQALGFKLLDQNGHSIGFGGGTLADLFEIDRSEIHPLLSSAKITIACDVQNPLIGPSGATNVYAPQKGAGAEMLTVLESGMTHYSNVLKAEFGSDYSEVPGAGAAGGLGAGLMAFCNAKMRSGFELIAELTDLERHISQADLVITGEGKIDAQTAYGKTISGIAKLCRKHRVTLIALAGVVSGDLSELYQQGLTSALAIASGPITADESKRNATVLLEKTSEQLIRLVLARNN